MKKVAFTLIELIVAVSIIAIITGIFLANYFGGEPQSQIINATSALMRDLRLVQARATATINYGSDIPNAWGLYLSTSTGYTIFADISGGADYIYDGATESVASQGGRIVAYPEGVSSAYSVGDGDLNITFSHAADILSANFNDGSQFYLNQEITITLTEASTGLSKHVYINPFGLISSDL